MSGNPWLFKNSIPTWAPITLTSPTYLYFDTSLENFLNISSNLWTLSNNFLFIIWSNVDFDNAHAIGLPWKVLVWIPGGHFFSNFLGREKCYLILALINILYLMFVLSSLGTFSTSLIAVFFDYFTVHIVYLLLLSSLFFKRTKRFLGYEGL